MESHKIEIQLSNYKLVILLLGSVFFIGFGIWFQYLAVDPPVFSFPLLSQPILYRLLGLLAILFFGFCGLFAARKLQDRAPGLIISEEGITDNSSAVPGGLIPWEDITEVKEAGAMDQRFIMLILRNPEDYINRHKGLKRSFVAANFRNYGSPVAISASGLKCSNKELKETLLENFRRYKKN